MMKGEGGEVRDVEAERTGEGKEKGVVVVRKRQKKKVQLILKYVGIKAR